MQQSSSLDWSRARGAFHANGRIYYGWDDGKIHRRKVKTSGSAAQRWSRRTAVAVVLPDPCGHGHVPVRRAAGVHVAGRRSPVLPDFDLEANGVGAVTFAADGPGTGFNWGPVRELTHADGTLSLARAVDVERRLEPGPQAWVPVSGSLQLIDNDPSQHWASGGMYVKN